MGRCPLSRERSDCLCNGQDDLGGCGGGDLRSVPRLVSGRSVQVRVQVGTISEVEMDAEGDRKKDLSEKTREEIQDDLDNKRLG